MIFGSPRLQTRWPFFPPLLKRVQLKYRTLSYCRERTVLYGSFSLRNLRFCSSALFWMHYLQKRSLTKRQLFKTIKQNGSANQFLSTCRAGSSAFFLYWISPTIARWSLKQAVSVNFSKKIPHFDHNHNNNLATLKKENLGL